MSDSVALFLDIDGVLNTESSIINNIHLSSKKLSMIQQFLLDIFEDNIKIIIFGGGINTNEKFESFKDQISYLGIKTPSVNFIGYINKMNAFDRIKKDKNDNLLFHYLQMGIPKENACIVDDEVNSARIFELKVIGINSEYGIDLGSIADIIHFILKTIKPLECPKCKSKQVMLKEFVENLVITSNIYNSDRIPSQISIPNVSYYRCEACSTVFFPKNNNTMKKYTMSSEALQFQEIDSNFKYISNI